MQREQIERQIRRDLIKENVVRMVAGSVAVWVFKSIRKSRKEQAPE